MASARAVSPHYLGTPKEPSKYLLPERLVIADGHSSSAELGSKRGKLMVVTLEITRVTERDCLVVSVAGSADNVTWVQPPLLTFPQKSYCGIYSALLDLSRHSEIAHLRVQWALRRWRNREAIPIFGFSVFAVSSRKRISLRKKPQD